MSRVEPAGPQDDRPLELALFALTATAGTVDAASYLGLGSVFTANMTGNVVLLGFGSSGATDLPIVAPLVSLTAFLLGATIGGRLSRDRAGRYAEAFMVALACETVLLTVATAITAAAPVGKGTLGGYAAIAALATAMGVRTALVRSLKLPDLRTTVLTLTLAGLAADSPPAGGSGARSGVRAGSALAMFGGALGGALLEQLGVAAPLAVAAGAGLLTLAGYAYARRRSRRTGPAGARTG